MAVEFSIHQGSRLQEIAREFSQEDESNLAKMKDRSFRRRTSSSLSLTDSILSSPVTPAGLSQEELRQEKASREMVSGLYQSVNATLQSSPSATPTPVLFSLSEAQVQAYERSIRTLREALEEAIANHDDKELYKVVERMIHETPDRQLKRFRRERLLEALRKDFDREVRGNEFAWFDNRSEDGLALMAHSAGGSSSGDGAAGSQAEVNQLRSDMATLREESRQTVERLQNQMDAVLRAVAQAQEFSSTSSDANRSGPAPASASPEIVADHPNKSEELAEQIDEGESLELDESAQGNAGTRVEGAIPGASHPEVIGANATDGQEKASPPGPEVSDKTQASPLRHNPRGSTESGPEFGYAKTFTPGQKEGKGKATTSAEPAVPKGADSSQTNKQPSASGFKQRARNLFGGASS